MATRMTNSYRLARVKQAGTTAQEVIIGHRLEEYLERPVWPDVPFAVNIPLWNPPKKWAYVLKDPPPVNPSENPYRKITSPAYIAYEEAYEAQIAVLEDKMRRKLTITRSWMDYETGIVEWRPTDRDLWRAFIDRMMMFENPVAWLAYSSMYRNPE